MQLHEPFRTVTPTVDGPVLAILALADESFTPGQLGRMLPYSDEGIRKVLRRLNAQGILDSERHGSTTAYRLNREHLAAAPIIALAKLKSTLLERIEAELATWEVPAVYAAVFGSAGRGSMNESSDIDILVVGPDGEAGPQWVEQLARLAGDVTRWTGNDAQVLELEESQVRAEEAVLRDVLRDGLTVAGKPSWLRDRMRVKARP